MESILKCFREFFLNVLGFHVEIFLYLIYFYFFATIIIILFSMIVAFFRNLEVYGAFEHLHWPWIIRWRRQASIHVSSVTTHSPAFEFFFLFSSRNHQFHICLLFNPFTYALVCLLISIFCFMNAYLFTFLLYLFTFNQYIKHNTINFVFFFSSHTNILMFSVTAELKVLWLFS